MKILITEGQYSRLITENETLKDFYIRFNENNRNSDFLINHFKNPNFQLRLTHDGGIKFIKDYECEHNRCETNTFKVLKRLIGRGVNRYFPVSGWAFMKSTTYFEHFWMYDKVEDMFIDVTPMTGEKPYAYGGVVNYNLNQDILNADKFSDIEFLKGKHHTSLYSKFKDNQSNPVLDNKRTQMDMMDYIHGEPNYKEISTFIRDNNIHDIEQLQNVKYRLEDKMDQSKSSREFQYLNKLIDQIDSLGVSLK